MDPGDFRTPPAGWRSRTSASPTNESSSDPVLATRVGSEPVIAEGPPTRAPPQDLRYLAFALGTTSAFTLPGHPLEQLLDRRKFTLEVSRR